MEGYNEGVPGYFTKHVLTRDPGPKILNRSKKGSRFMALQQFVHKEKKAIMPGHRDKEIPGLFVEALTGTAYAKCDNGQLVRVYPRLNGVPMHLYNRFHKETKEFLHA